MLLHLKLAYANVCNIMQNHSQIIDALGGNIAVGKLCDNTNPAIVSGWRKRGIPKAWRVYLKQLRPDVFQPNTNTESA